MIHSTTLVDLLNNSLWIKLFKAGMGGGVGSAKVCWLFIFLLSGNRIDAIGRRSRDVPGEFRIQKFFEITGYKCRLPLRKFIRVGWYKFQRNGELRTCIQNESTDSTSQYFLIRGCLYSSIPQHNEEVGLCSFSETSIIFLKDNVINICCFQTLQGFPVTVEESFGLRACLFTSPISSPWLLGSVDWLF